MSRCNLAKTRCRLLTDHCSTAMWRCSLQWWESTLLWRQCKLREWESTLQRRKTCCNDEQTRCNDEQTRCNEEQIRCNDEKACCNDGKATCNGGKQPATTRKTANNVTDILLRSHIDVYLTIANGWFCGVPKKLISPAYNAFTFAVCRFTIAFQPPCPPSVCRWSGGASLAAVAKAMAAEEPRWILNNYYLAASCLYH